MRGASEHHLSSAGLDRRGPSACSPPMVTSKGGGRRIEPAVSIGCSRAGDRPAPSTARAFISTYAEITFRTRSSMSRTAPSSTQRLSACRRGTCNASSSRTGRRSSCLTGRESPPRRISDSRQITRSLSMPRRSSFGSRSRTAYRVEHVSPVSNSVNKFRWRSRPPWTHLLLAADISHAVQLIADLAIFPILRKLRSKPWWSRCDPTIVRSAE